MALETAKTRIKKALRMAGLNQSRLAEVLGVDRGAVSDMLKRDGEPPIKYVQATADLTGFNFHWIETGKGPEKGTEQDLTEPVVQYNDKSTIAQLERLVASQDQTIQLLNEKIKRLEEELKEKKKV